VRGAHLALVHLYIYKQAEEQGIQRNVITGTGGAPIETYLANRFSQTRSSMLHHAHNF